MAIITNYTKSGMRCYPHSAFFQIRLLNRTLLSNVHLILYFNPYAREAALPSFLRVANVIIALDTIQEGIRTVTMMFDSRSIIDSRSPSIEHSLVVLAMVFFLHHDFMMDLR